MKLSKGLFLSILLSLVLVFTAVGGIYATENNFDAKSKLEELRSKRKEQIEKEKERLQKIKENKKEAVDKFKEKRDELKEKEASRRAEVKQKVAEKVKELLLRAAEHQGKTLERLDKIAEKIAARIDKLNEKGVNTGNALNELAEAEATGAVAQQAISDAKASIEAIDPSTADAAAVEVAKETLRKSKKSLFDYHKALVEALRELKASKALREGTNAATP